MAGSARKISGLMNSVKARKNAKEKLRNASGVGDKIEKGINRDRFWGEARKASKKIMAREEAEYQMKNARPFHAGEDRDDEHRAAWRGIDQTGEQIQRNKTIRERTGTRKTTTDNAAEEKARKNAVNAMKRVDNEDGSARTDEMLQAWNAINRVGRKQKR